MNIPSMRTILEALLESNVKPYHYDVKTNMLLFTEANLDAFAHNWQFDFSKETMTHQKVSLCWDVMNDKIISKGPGPNAVKPRSRLAAPFVLGLQLVRAEDLDSIVVALRLNPEGTLGVFKP